MLSRMQHAARKKDCSLLLEVAAATDGTQQHSSNVPLCSRAALQMPMVPADHSACMGMAAG